MVSIWARRLQSRPAHHDWSNFTSVPYSHYPLRVEWGEMLLLSDRAGAPHRASLKAELLLMPGAGDNGVSSHLVASEQRPPHHESAFFLSRGDASRLEVVAVRCSACESRGRVGDLTHLWPSAEKGAECPCHPAELTVRLLCLHNARPKKSRFIWGFDRKEKRPRGCGRRAKPKLCFPGPQKLERAPSPAQEGVKNPENIDWSASPRNGLL